MQALNYYGDVHYNGEAVVTWLTENADWSIYLAALYLAFVFWGPFYIERNLKDKNYKKLLKKIWGLWNIGLVIFSLYGSIIITPTLIRNFQNLGAKATLCEYRPNEVVFSRVGFAMGMFAISKLFEFGDTFFMLMTNPSNLRFMSWFHHITIFLYSWYAYQQRSTIFIVIASMNYPVHTVMYLYFALAELIGKEYVKRYAIYITLIQICQMIGGIIMTTMTQYYKFQDPAGCLGATWGLCRGQQMIYISNLYLFSELFIKTYIRKKPIPADKEK